MELGRYGRRGSDEGEKMEGAGVNLWGGVGVFRLRLCNYVEICEYVEIMQLIILRRNEAEG